MACYASTESRLRVIGVRDAGTLAVTYHNTGSGGGERAAAAPPGKHTPTPLPAPPRPHPPGALHVHAMHSLFMAATTLCSSCEFFSRCCCAT